MNENNNPVATPKVIAKITWLNNNPTAAKKASANITIADSFMVRGLSIVEGPKGLFISMPQRQSDKDGEKRFLEIAHPVTAEMRKAIQDVVFKAYTQTIALSQQIDGAYARQETPSQVNYSLQPANGGVMTPPPLDPALSQEYSAVPIMGQTM